MKTRSLLYILLWVLIFTMSACSPWKAVTWEQSLYDGMTPRTARAVISRLNVKTDLTYRCQTDTRWVVSDDYPFFPRILRHGGEVFSPEMADREEPIYTYYPVSLKEILEMEGKHDIKLLYHEGQNLYRVDIHFTPSCALREYQKVTLLETPSKRDAEDVIAALTVLWR